LEKWPSFVGIDMNFFALLDGSADDAESSAISCGRERAGIAVRLD
jgi:hypothetical protein